MHRVDQHGRRKRLGVATSIAAVVALALVSALPASASAAEKQLTIQLAGSGSGSVKCEVEGEVGLKTCASKYPEGTELMLVPEASAGSEFVEFEGDCGPILCFLTMDEDHTAVAVFDKEPGVEEFSLTIATAGTGTGTIQCEAEDAPPGPCAAKYAEGTEVTVIAEADPGSEFKGFSGDCTGATCELTIDKAKSVTATFAAEPTEFALTIVKAGTGTGKVECEAEEGLGSCPAKYPANTEITLIASAESGSTFAGFSEGTGSAASCSTSPCTFTIEANSKVKATFNAVTPAPTVTSVSPNKGTTAGGTVVTITGTNLSGATEVKFGTTAATGVEVKSATEVKATSPAHAAGTVDVTVTTPGGTSATGAGDKFTYEAPVTEFTLTIVKNGTGSGSVTCNGGACAAKYAAGTKVTLAASAASGSTFAGWSGGGCSGTGSCVVTMSANKEVTATFNLVKPRFTLEILKQGTGSGTVTSSPAGISCGSVCSAEFEEGKKVTLTATADEGSVFVRWFGMPGACTEDPVCTTTMAKARVVTAKFTAVGQRTLTVKKAGSGAGTVTSSPSGINCGSTCAASFDVLSKVTLTATAASGSSFTGWSGACTGAGTCKVTMKEARSVTATFDAPPPPPPAGNGLAVIGGTVKIKKGKKALLRVLCNGPSSCKGTVKLLIRAKLDGKTKTVTAGSADFKLEAGASITLTIQLSRKARQLLTQGKQVQGRVTGTGLHPHGVRLKLV